MPYPSRDSVAHVAESSQWALQVGTFGVFRFRLTFNIAKGVPLVIAHTKSVMLNELLLKCFITFRRAAADPWKSLELLVTRVAERFLAIMQEQHQVCGIKRKWKFAFLAQAFIHNSSEIHNLLNMVFVAAGPRLMRFCGTSRVWNVCLQFLPKGEGWLAIWFGNTLKQVFDRCIHANKRNKVFNKEKIRQLGFELSRIESLQMRILFSNNLLAGEMVRSPNFGRA